MVPGNIEVTEEEEGGAGRRTTTLSRLRFRPGPEDNQAGFACEAAHPALAGPMRADLLLSVLYPPEKPEITGYIQGETIRMGATVKIVCHAYGGNPLAQVVWFKNNQRIDHSYTTTGARSENTFMFLAQPDDNNAVYRCEAKNRMVVEPLTAEIVMSVQCKSLLLLLLSLLLLLLLFTEEEEEEGSQACLGLNICTPIYFHRGID